MANNGLLGFGICALASLGVVLFGCPAPLDDPDGLLQAALEARCGEPFRDGAALLAERCGEGSCHGANDPAGGLDLASPDLAVRLRNKPVRDCNGKKHLNLANPADSYLLEKVELAEPSCGQQMPPTHPLDPLERECLFRFLQAAAASASASVVGVAGSSGAQL